MNRNHIAIATPIDPNNFGNRLQNYAVHEICKKLGLKPVTLLSIPQRKKICILSIISKFKLYIFLPGEKSAKVLKMVKGLNFSKKYIEIKSFYCKKQYRNLHKKYEYGGIGGDQIWSRYWSERVDFCDFVTLNKNKKICFAPSIGKIDLKPDEQKQLYKIIKDIEKIAVREISAKKIVEKLLGKECEVILDPVFMLSSFEWHRISTEIQNLPKSYVVKYLFTEEENYDVAVSEFALQLDGEVVDVMDEKQKKYYAIDPGEFVYLIENASLVCTDSYHAVLMAMIFHKPFVIFDRKSNGQSVMNTRFETIDNIFDIKHRYFEYVNQDKISHNIIDFDNMLESKQLQAWEYYYSIIGKEKDDTN